MPEDLEHGGHVDPDGQDGRLDVFLDTNSWEPLIEHLRSLGLDASAARERASAIDAFMLGVSTRRRVLRADLDDPAEIEAWLGAAIQRSRTVERPTTDGRSPRRGTHAPIALRHAARDRSHLEPAGDATA